MGKRVTPRSSAGSKAIWRIAGLILLLASTGCATLQGLRNPEENSETSLQSYIPDVARQIQFLFIPHQAATQLLLTNTVGIIKPSPSKE